MVDGPDLLSDLYRISLAIGSRLNLEEMLEEALTTYLHVLDGIAGEIYFLRTPENGAFSYERIYGFHRIVGKNGHFQQALIDPARVYDTAEWEGFLNTLPRVEETGEHFAHVMELPQVGLIILFTREAVLGPEILQGLKPVNDKLADACRNCITHQTLAVAHEKTTRSYQKILQKNREFQQARRAFLKIIGDFQSMTKALRDWDAYLHQIFADVHEIPFRLDGQGHILQISPLISRYSGYEPGELVGKAAKEFFFDPLELREICRTLQERGHIRDFPLHLKSKNQQLLYAVLWAHAIFDEDGAISGFEGRIGEVYEWSVDALELEKACKALAAEVSSGPPDARMVEKEIAYRRQAEAALKKVSALNEQIMASVSAMLIGIDENDRITHWNDAAERLTGIPRSEVLGGSFLKCGLRWNWDKIVKSISTCLEQERPVKLKNFYFHRSNERKTCLNITLKPVFNERSEPAGILLIGENLPRTENPRR